MAVKVSSSGSGLEMQVARPLFAIPVATSSYPYDVAHDGEGFLVLAPAEKTEREPLSVVYNWQAALKR